VKEHEYKLIIFFKKWSIWNSKDTLRSVVLHPKATMTIFWHFTTWLCILGLITSQDWITITTQWLETMRFYPKRTFNDTWYPITNQGHYVRRRFSDRGKEKI
jgi:hypothetical protein